MKRIIFDDEHEWFREAVAQFAERALLPAAERTREQRTIDRALWKEAGDHGFLGLGVPAEHGGADTADFRFNAVFGEELAARAGLAYASSFGIQTDVVAPYLVELATREGRTGGCLHSARASWSPRSA